VAISGGDARRRWDFFVSYTQADRVWAEWIAWVLEEDGYQVLIQAWDFVPGSNWISGMQAGTRDAVRTIAVLSEAYLRSAYSPAEWQPALADDPDGSDRKLLVVRVARCRRPGLLAGVVAVDLFGMSEADATASLRKMVTDAATGRAKPAVPPAFPGERRGIRPEPGFPGGPPRVSPSPYRDTGRTRTNLWDTGRTHTKSAERTAGAARSGSTSPREYRHGGRPGPGGSTGRGPRSVRNGSPGRSGSAGKSPAGRSAKPSPAVPRSRSTLQLGSNSSRRGKAAGFGWILCQICWFFGTVAACSIPVFIPNGPAPSTTRLITALGIFLASLIIGGLSMLFRKDR
jgi:hypothetical protein